ncbi:MAG: helix-turn-helix transcriptional regulator [Rhodobacteraceae bacterium]|nr:helix-turn-helix transcriptional regulator [Paracoccaceae bacterium]
MSNPTFRQTPRAISLEACGLAVAAEFLSDRWVLLILRELFYGVGRFEDIRTELQIPKSVLSARLAALMDKGLVEKQPYKAEGSRTRSSYHLTKMGGDLAVTFLALLEWGNKHLEVATPPVEAVDKTSRRPLRVMVVDRETQKPVALRDVRFAVKQD